MNTDDPTKKMTTKNQLIIANETPLVLGAAQNTTIAVDSGNFSLNSRIPGQNFVIKVNSEGVAASSAQASLTSAVVVSSLARRVGVFLDTPTETLDVNGNARVRGNLTLNGTSVIITTPLTPASPTAAGTSGQVAWDADYIYVCVATDTWKRVAIDDSGW